MRFLITIHFVIFLLLSCEIEEELENEGVINHQDFLDEDNDPNQEYRYYASDVVKYAMTSHGINYLLRNHKDSINAWEVVDQLENYRVDSKRFGNTDCSGLVSAAIRIGGYRHPSDKNKPALGTWTIYDAAKNSRHNLTLVGTTQTLRELTRHGDMLNRTGSPYGHVVLYNGENERGQLETVEARCTQCGVGRFTRSWNEMYNGGYRTIRSHEVYYDVVAKNHTFTLSDANSDNQIFTDPRKKANEKNKDQDFIEYSVKPEDTGIGIARQHGISFDNLEQQNPNINWSRLQIGQKIQIPI